MNRVFDRRSCESRNPATLVPAEGMQRRWIPASAGMTVSKLGGALLAAGMLFAGNAAAQQLFRSAGFRDTMTEMTMDL